MQSRQVSIIKANGRSEPFDPEKLLRSLTRSGADSELAEEIADRVASSLKGGERTRDIYAKAFTALRDAQRSTAARYSVKRALLELGPTGYPFEDFVAEIFGTRGYTTETRVMRSGRCVEHELDMVAVRDTEMCAAEVKFHNSAGTKSDLKVALYVHARFLDIGANKDLQPINTPMLITNTKFSSHAVAYAECVGLTLIGWDYPKKGNMRELIEESGVHPVSCLTTLSTARKRALMTQGIVLCRQLRANREAMRALGMSDTSIEQVLDETQHLCR